MDKFDLCVQKITTSGSTQPRHAKIQHYECAESYWSLSEMSDISLQQPIFKLNKDDGASIALIKREALVFSEKFSIS